VNGIWQDVVLDVRTHLKTPIVTAAIVASLAFGLAAETLTVGPARGVSNRVATPHPRVELASGALLVVHAPGEELPGSSRLPGS